jgi:hypothetical protein
MVPHATSWMRRERTAHAQQLRALPHTEAHHDRTTHCFRHTMRDRLREVEAPHDIQHAIGGWGKQDQGDKYGRGYKLDVLLPWLNKVVV